MTEVAPITDEELARLEEDIADGTILGLYCDRLIARLRAAEARAEKAEAAVKSLEQIQADFLAEMDRQHADCESRRETAERERDALVAKVHEVYAQGPTGPLWKVREWMNVHITGAKNEGKGG